METPQVWSKECVEAFFRPPQHERQTVSERICQAKPLMDDRVPFALKIGTVVPCRTLNGSIRQEMAFDVATSFRKSSRQFHDRSKGE